MLYLHANTFQKGRNPSPPHSCLLTDLLSGKNYSHLTLKQWFLSNHKIKLGQYLDGWWLGNIRYCKLCDRPSKLAINTISLLILTEGLDMWRCSWTDRSWYLPGPGWDSYNSKMFLTLINPQSHKKNYKLFNPYLGEEEVGSCFL